MTSAIEEKFLSFYDHKQEEEVISKRWFSSNIYKWDQNGDKATNYIIDTPPPGVSGLLHMGHVFSYCHTDFIARFKRMKGYNVFYPIGFDDNGQPSEKLVEKVLGQRLCDIQKQGRLQEFLDKCDNITLEAEKDFEVLFKTLGFSYDWTQSYRTISDRSRVIAEFSYCDLIDKGLIYRKEGPVYWDVVDQTALSQADIIDKELDSIECVFYFESQEGEKLPVMSTRVEMLPSCLALLFNPNDPRYSMLVNKFAIVPISQHVVPILADEEVKIDKGTGLVMCCSYGDQQDVIWAKKHNLKTKIIINKEGKIENLSVKKAKELTIEKLKQAGLLIDVKNSKNIVKCGEYSKAPVEILESSQCFLRTLEFKDDLLEIIKYLNFYPAHMKSRLEQWILGLNQDWCISRDRAFGIKIPDSNQVFDTWFTSSVSPQLNSFAISTNYQVDIKRHKKLYPSNLRPQSHEIIRTWAFYTILKAYLHGLTKEEFQDRKNFLCKGNASEWLRERFGKEEIIERFLPWKDIVLSGWCLAKDGTKMSKSKGNAVTPIDLIKDKGVDVVRYWAASVCLGVDTAYNETKFIDGKKLINKLWNASKFCFNFYKNIISNSDKKDIEYAVKNVNKPFDRVILHKLNNILQVVENHFENNYEYSKAKEEIERFFWHDFCDNYIEIVKTRAYNKCPSACATLYIVHSTLLKLFAIFIPYVTEKIYNEIGYKESIHSIGNWPLKIDIKITDNILNECEDALKVILFVRKEKANRQLSVKAAVRSISLPALGIDIMQDLLSVINAHEADITIAKDLSVTF
jgi:valyl-tRNA synthetase